MRRYWNLPSHLAWTSDAQNLILSFVSTTEVLVFFHSQPYFGFSILINKMHFKLVSSFFYSAGETERGGLVSVWCNVLGQHKTFFVASPKKKIIFSCESRQARTSQLFYSGCYTEKNSLITQRYAAIPQDEWPFVFVLFWVQWGSSLLLHVISSLFCLFVCLCSCEHTVIDTCPNQGYQYHRTLSKEVLHVLPFIPYST